MCLTLAPPAYPHERTANFSQENGDGPRRRNSTHEVVKLVNDTVRSVFHGEDSEYVDRFAPAVNPDLEEDTLIV